MCFIYFGVKKENREEKREKKEERKRNEAIPDDPPSPKGLRS
jgi:hypothetical protein